MRRRPALTILILVALAATPAAAVPSPTLPLPCAATPLVEGTAAPDYYAIDLVSTGRVPGTRSAAGAAAVTFAPSPFGIAVTPQGDYRQTLRIAVEGLRAPAQGAYAVWITTPQLDAVRFVGFLDENGRIEGSVTFNKFLVVISLEDSVDALGERWRGPVVLRGMSRSGRMHTMAGHGPFQAEPCLKYGY